MSRLPLRPPGAIDEDQFVRRCIQCGRCAQVCPFQSVVLTAPGNGDSDPRALGSPRIAPWATPCWLCMRCPPACPTGALAPVTAMQDAGMGLAVLDKERCYTYEGSIFCKTCHEKCPLRNSALIMENGILPVITDQCVGCGVCEKVCPRKAIVTVPTALLSRAARTGGQP